MKVAVFSTKPYDEAFLRGANAEVGHDLVFFEPRLHGQTCRLADGFPAVCPFVNDQLDADVLGTLTSLGTRLWTSLEAMVASSAAAPAFRVGSCVDADAPVGAPAAASTRLPPA